MTSFLHDNKKLLKDTCRDCGSQDIDGQDPYEENPYAFYRVCISCDSQNIEVVNKSK
jgi:hypothetical protein